MGRAGQADQLADLPFGNTQAALETGHAGAAAIGLLDRALGFGRVGQAGSEARRVVKIVEEAVGELLARAVVAGPPVAAILRDQS